MTRQRTLRGRISPVIAVFAIVGLVGCGKADSDTKKSSNAPAVQPSPTRPAPPDTKKTQAANDNKIKLTGLAAFATADYVKGVIAKRDSDHWYGLYLRGQKAGYANLRMRKTKPGEPGGFLARISLAMKADGDKMQFIYKQYFEAAPPYKMVSMTVQQKSGAENVIRTYTPKGAKTEVASTIDGKPGKTLTIDTPCEKLDVLFAQMVPNLTTLAKDSRAEYCTFDSSENVNETHEVKVEELASRRINGVAVKVVKLATKDKKDKVWQTMVVAEGGVTLEMAFGEGMQLKLEDKKVAQSNVTGVDVNSMAIKVAKPLGDPTKIKELKMIVKVTKGFEIPSGPNQLVKARPDGRFDVTIRAVPGPKVKPDERAPALKTTANINADDPKIVALAKQITANAKTPKEKVAALNAWVYKNLRKTLSTNLTTATQVLEHKAGDCTEHSILLVALVRSLGIPARELSGVVYDNEQLVGFGWHAWTEVELDGHWVQVDPSWNEPIANATHLKLGAGDKDEGGANMGSLGIEIVYPVN